VYNPDIAATAGESFLNSGNIRFSGACLQQSDLINDHASQHGKAGKLLSQLVFLKCNNHLWHVGVCTETTEQT